MKMTNVMDWKRDLDINFVLYIVGSVFLHRYQPPKNNFRDKKKLSLGRGDAIMENLIASCQYMSLLESPYKTAIVDRSY